LVPAALSGIYFERKGASQMLSTYQLLRNGPYLRVVVPDVMPPDWGALRKDVLEELEEGGVDRVSIVTPHFFYDRADRESLMELFYDLYREGVAACIEWRDRAELTSGEDVTSITL